jgi:hypothetical protein
VDDGFKSFSVGSPGIAMTQAKQRLVILAFSLVAFLPGSGVANDDGGDRAIVDCSRGQSISDGLGKNNGGRPITVVVRGNCVEQVVITRDDASLVGEGGTVTGGLTINGARRVEIAKLNIRNPLGDGILVDKGASVTIRENEISDSAGYGILVRNASLALVNDNQLHRNGVVGNTNIDASGIGATLGSTVSALRNTIGENYNAGIEVFDNSTYRSEGDTVAMRLVGPARPNGSTAVDTYRAGYVDLRSATVNGLMFVNQQSQLQVRPVVGAPPGTVTIAGNISVGQLSFLRLRSGVVRAQSMLGCGPSAVCQCDGLPDNLCPSNVP